MREVWNQAQPLSHAQEVARSERGDDNFSAALEGMVKTRSQIYHLAHLLLWHHQRHAHMLRHRTQLSLNFHNLIIIRIPRPLHRRLYLKPCRLCHPKPLKDLLWQITLNPCISLMCIQQLFIYHYLLIKRSKLHLYCGFCFFFNCALMI
jgi:hypothetical protein